MPCGWGWPFSLGLVQRLRGNCSRNYTLMNYIPASEELWVSATSPGKDGGLARGEIPHKSQLRLHATGCGLQWVLLAEFVQAKKNKQGWRMDPLAGPQPSPPGHHAPLHSFGSLLARSGISTPNLEENGLMERLGTVPLPQGLSVWL